MTDDELIARATAGEGGAWSWEALVEELSKRLAAANADAAHLAKWLGQAGDHGWTDRQQYLVDHALAAHHRRIEGK